MHTLLAVIRFAGLAVFGVSAFLVLAVLLNYMIDFTSVAWLEIYFIRLYLFFAVLGILAYILITFRRRKGE